MRLLPAVATAVTLVALAGCGAATSPVGPPDPPADPSLDAATGLRLPATPPEPQDVRFHVLGADGQQLDLAPWTACLGNGCWDGAPDDDHLPDVGSPPVLDVGFDLDGWSFEGVTVRELGVPCPRRITVAAEKTGARTFRVVPAGPAGTWAVDVSGRGPEGDAVTTVLWHTPVSGPVPGGATGSAAVLADHDGALDSYGVELFLGGLDRRYSPDAATVDVTDAEGGRVRLEVPRSGGDDCWSEGDLSFTAPDAVGRRATTLGPGPFTYTVRVRLGATTYTGTGTWPDGETEDMAPHVALAWDPPLPAYTG